MARAKKKKKKKSAKKAQKRAKKTPRAAPKRGAGSAGRGRPETNSPAIADVEYLMELMEARDIAEVSIDDGSSSISVKRNLAAGPMVPQHPELRPSPPPHAAPAGAGEAVAEPAPAKDDEELTEITSPIVGTFYAAPSPESDPYVKTGDVVNADTVVCIVEAMKVMNEIKAECAGTIAEISVENAEPVEFGQVMFRVRPE